MIRKLIFALIFLLFLFADGRPLHILPVYGEAPPYTFEELDGDPSVTFPVPIRLPNGSLVENADGSITLTWTVTEADTLDTVSDRGATTPNILTTGGIIVGDDDYVGTATNRFLFDDTGGDITTTSRLGLGDVTNPIKQFEIWEADGSGEIYLIRKDDSIMGNNDLGEIFFGGSGTVDVKEAASIKVEAADDWTDDDAAPTRMGFYTLKQGEPTTQERLLIDHNGDVKMGNVTANINCGDFYMIKGATAGDPQVKFELQTDGDFEITADTGDILLTPTNDVIIATGKHFKIGTTQWNSGDDIDGTKIADADLGQVSWSGGSVTVEDFTLNTNADANNNRIVNLANPVNPLDAVNLDTLFDHIGILYTAYLRGSNILSATLTEGETADTELLNETPVDTLSNIFYKSTVADTPTPFVVMAGSLINFHFDAKVDASGKKATTIQMRLFYMDGGSDAGKTGIAPISTATAELTDTQTSYQVHSHVATEITVPAGKRLWIEVTANTTGAQAYPTVSIYRDSGAHHISFGVAGGVLANFVRIDGTAPMTADWDIGNFDITLKSLTASGTGTFDVLNEGGTAVINATEGGAWTGTHDFGGANLEAPNTAGDVAVGTAGQLAVDITQKQLAVGDGSVEYVIPLRHIIQGQLGTGDFDADPDVFILSLDSDVYPDGIVITKWTVDCNEADPSTEFNADLYYANDRGTGDFPSAGGVTLVDVLDTTTGNSSENDMSASDLTSGVIPTGVELYIIINIDPTEDDVLFRVKIHFYIPES